MSDNDLKFVKPQMTWSSKWYYEVGLITMVLGIGNTLDVFRFVREFDASFVLSCITLNVVLAFPIVILELSMSQYGQKDMIQIWELCPMFKSLGYYCLVYMFSLAVEDVLTLVHLARYVINSFSTITGWDSCDNPWNDEFCFTSSMNMSRRLDCYELHGEDHCNSVRWQNSHEQYWIYISVNAEYRAFPWKNTLYCLGVVAMAYSFSCKGVKTIEKIIFGSLIVGMLELCILIYVSYTQVGSAAGLRQFFYWKNIVDYYAWAKCFSHVVRSTFIGTGGLRTFGSQNHFRGNSYMNGMMLIIVNLTISGLYMNLYLSLTGNLSHVSYGETVEDVMKRVEPEYWSKLPRMINILRGPKRLWLFLFYTQVYLTIFAKLLVVMSVIMKTIFNLLPHTERYFKTTCFGLYITTFCLIIPILLDSQQFIWLQVIDVALRGSVAIAMTLLQTTVVVYIYGMSTLVDDLHFMWGFRLPIGWQVLIFFSPVTLLIGWIMHLSYYYSHMDASIKNSYAKKVIMELVSYSPIYVTLIYALWFTRKLIWNRSFEYAFKPSEKWYLTDPTLRKSREMFSSLSMTKEYLYRQTKRKETEAYEADDIYYNDD